MPGLRGEEEWARQMMEAALGVLVVQHDDGSLPGMHDLEVHLTEEVRGAVEVTAAADPHCIELWKLMNGHDERWIEGDLRGGWMVTLRPAARARRLRVELPDLLRDMEETGHPGFHRPRAHRSRVEALAEDLGIVGLHQGGTDFPGSIYITIDDDIDRRAGWSDASPSVFVEWVGNFLSSPDLADVRRKLGGSGCAETHAFILVPGFTTAPFGVANLLMGYGTPTSAPVLPEEVGHVWLASTWSVGSGWRWSKVGGWQPFDKQQEA